MLRRRVRSGTCAWVRRNFSLGPAGRCDGEEAAEGRKCEGGAVGGEGRASVHDTTYDPLVEEPLSGGAHNSLRVPRPDPPLLPSIIFPLGPALVVLFPSDHAIFGNRNFVCNSQCIQRLKIGRASC